MSIFFGDAVSRDDWNAPTAAWPPGRAPPAPTRSNKVQGSGNISAPRSALPRLRCANAAAYSIGISTRIGTAARLLGREHNVERGESNLILPVHTTFGRTNAHSISPGHEAIASPAVPCGGMVPDTQRARLVPCDLGFCSLCLSVARPPNAKCARRRARCYPSQSLALLRRVESLRDRSSRESA